MKVKELKIGDDESDKSFPRGGGRFWGDSGFFIGAQSHAQIFTPFFLTGVCPVGRG